MKALRFLVRLTAPLTMVSLLAACGIPPSQRSSRPEAGAAGRSAAGITRSEAQCLAQLDASGDRFTPLPDRYYGGGCSTVGTVKLDAVAGDTRSFTLTNLGPVACPLAQTFTAWARYGVDRAARQILGSPLARIETMGSYSCRTIAGSTRLSAHARAQAIDIAAFDLADGRRISVKDGWYNGNAKEREFLRVVHASACKRFGTVLGPEYNPAHQNHFHLELDGRSFCR